MCKAQALAGAPRNSRRWAWSCRRSGPGWTAWKRRCGCSGALRPRRGDVRGRPCPSPATSRCPRCRSTPRRCSSGSP